MRMRNWLLTGAAACVLVLSQADIANAQAITGALRGQISGANGTPVAGAIVKVTSNDTGATITTTTGAGGSFSVPALSVAGTYTVRVQAEGYGVKTISNISLSLGETSSLNLHLNELPAETVVVTGARQTGAATAIVETSGVGASYDLAAIRNTPTVEHDIKDIVQNSPFAFVDPIGGGDNPPVATLSIAGSNPRCQNFLVDGIQVKDNFGLNLQGYPTARSPVPTEWTDQVQVVATPYDVEYNDTCGGTINLVTKSGSNEFHGGAYFYFKNDSLNGQSFKDQHGNEVSPTVPTFDEKNYGAYLSGPIIDDKLFFFVAYDELQRTSAPGANAVGPSDNSNFVNQAPGITQAEVDQVTQIAKDVYGFDAGNLSDNFTEYNQRYMAKLTWQIDDNNKLIAAYSHTAGGTLATGGGRTTATTPQVVLPSNWYIDAEKLETYSLHYTGRWSDNLSAEVFLAHEGVKGLQTPLGGTNFPEVSVRVPGVNGVYDYGTATASNGSSDDGYITLGPDIYRHWNFLYYKNDSAKAMLSYILGDHIFKVGAEIHRIGIINSFTPGSQSVVRFDSISDFQNGIIAQTMDRRSNVRSQLSGTGVYYSSGPDGNPADADADFGFYIESAFVQDEWHPLEHLKIEAGVRYDQYVSHDRPVLNPYFTQRYGYTNTRNVNGLNALLPRLSFTYSDWVPDQDIIPDTAITFRGGAGRYSGGFQTVWISNSYANTGVTSVTTFGFPGGGGTGTCTAANPFGCVPTVMPTDHQQWLADLNAGPLSLASVQQTSSVNAIMPNFKMPNTWRYNLGYDVYFGDGWLGSDWQWSFDVLAMSFQNQPYWKNLRVEPSGATAPDGRMLYKWVFDAANPDPVTGKPLTFGSDIGMGSKSGASGMYFITDVQKTWKNTGYGDFTVNFGYTHSHETEVSPATSSTASSSYSNRAGVNYNEPEIGTSDYQRDHRFVANVGIVERFIGDLETRFNLYFSRLSGQHYSPTYNSGSTFGPSGNSFYGSLIYIPQADSSGNVTANSDPKVAYGGSFDLAGFNTMLHQTGLIKYAGHIAPRGSLQGPWSTLINLGFEQEIPSYFEGHHLVASLDIFNLPNLINSKWGQFVYPPFPQNAELVSANIVNGQYQYTSYTGTVGPNYYRVTRTASTYQIQLGIRYEF